MIKKEKSYWREFQIAKTTENQVKYRDNLVLYDNIVTEKIAEMKWNKKSNSFLKKT